MTPTLDPDLGLLYGRKPLTGIRRPEPPGRQSVDGFDLCHSNRGRGVGVGLPIPSP